MAVWDGIIPDHDLAVYQAAQFGERMEMGNHPALVIVDVLWAFVGPRVDTLSAIAEYPTACGAVGWEAMERIRWLLDRFRAHGLPVVHVKAGSDPQAFGGTTKRPTGYRDPRAYEFPELVAPVAGEPVVVKSKASGFFRTPLDVLLHKRGVDTVLIAGSTTSGCIRATAVDAHSLGFATVVLEDGVFDRSPFSHAVSLFELQMKYAQVLSVEQAWQLLEARGMVSGMRGEESHV
ncbi:MAG: isochorismatase family protein [Firmicutes bacterium]|nr:isochorismatase family protein [Bacillota bacterium]